MLYSYKNQYPGTLPERIRLSNGNTKTDSSTFTQAELADAGYTLVSDPPEVVYPNKLSWENSAWVVLEPTPNEIYDKKEHIKNSCVDLLLKTDYKVIKAIENNEPVELSLKNYRQQLRDLYNSVDTVDIWNVSMPILLVEEKALGNDILAVMNAPNTQG
jgi:hypothetical protein